MSKLCLIGINRFLVFPSAFNEITLKYTLGLVIESDSIDRTSFHFILEEVGFALVYLTKGLSVARVWHEKNLEEKKTNGSHLAMTQRGACQTEIIATSHRRNSSEKN
jgi:hypothetical protein